MEEPDLIEAIIEYLPIDPEEGERGGHWKMFGIGHNDQINNYYYGEVKNLLENNSGIYIFYDSMGRAIYVGKTEKQSLWDEAVGAFNRPRDEHQAMFAVKHPNRNVQRVIRNRRIVRQPFVLRHVARYFSAYRVPNEKHISTMEAFLIRAFANNLLNRKIETFKLGSEA